MEYTQRRQNRANCRQLSARKGAFACTEDIDALHIFFSVTTMNVAHDYFVATNNMVFIRATLGWSQVDSALASH